MHTLLSLLLVYSLSSPLSTSTPPGTVEINGLFVDRTEIQNIHWLEFLYFQADQDKQALLPLETNQWYTEPALHYQPITHISKAQAEAYCRWRSEVVSKQLGREVRYRLPTPEEWTMVASHEWEQLSKRKKQKYEKSLLESVTAAEETGFPVLYTAEAGPMQLEHLFHNVSEMTTEQGLAMGASNNHTVASVQDAMQQRMSYDGPHPYVGFRCVAELVE